MGARRHRRARAQQFRFRSARFATGSATEQSFSAEDPYERARDSQRLLREVLEAQRDGLQVLRRGAIGDEVMRRVERDLDLEETRLDG